MLGPRRAPHAGSETTIILRIPQTGPLAGASIFGDLTSWSTPVPLELRGDATLAEVSLPIGTYVYKLRRTDGSWGLDPSNPRTRGVFGARNNLLVVGGAEEPVLHAPAAPYLALAHDGRILVRAGLRHRAGESMRLLWDEGDGLRASAMGLVGEEDEHRFFEVALPGSGRAVEYLFELPDGALVGRPGGAAQSLRFETAQLRSRAPAWWDDAVLYTIFVDRFRRGGGGTWGVDTATFPERLRAGGDLPGVTEALPYLADLGVNALHLTPILASPSAHRYDAVDPRAVDPALGGEAALGALLEEAHRRGIRVLLDLPITHVHRDFWAFRHVREHGPSSPYWGWFHCYRHPFREGANPGYRHYIKGAWQEPLLRTSEPEVADYLIGTFERWARFGVDGFRVDAAAEVPMELLRRIAPAVRRIQPDAVVYGEIIPDNVHRFTSGALDAATDFPAQEALFDWLLRGAGARRAAAAFSRRRLARSGTARTTLSFTATHDQPRLLTRSGRPEIARLGHLFTLLRAAVPALLYGDEAGMRSVGAARSFEDAWPDRACFDWTAATWDEVTRALFRDALRLRRERPALARGDESFFPARRAHTGGDSGPFGGEGPAEEEVLVLRRALWGEVVDVIFHTGSGPYTVALPDGAASSGRLLLAVGEARLDEREGLLTLGPASAAVVERAPPREIEQAISGAIEHNRLLAEEAYRRGETTTLSLPTNLSLVVTEACNLRCAHCITHAPQKTAAGAARQMAPWVWGALGEAFAAADYFAFVHGGESLSSPVLNDVLRAIARARGGRRYDVHLLTNGVLLDGERARQLVDLGLTSVSFSLDAATPEKNDALRRGGRFEEIVGHLREVLAVRAAIGADLRVGISMVAGRSTVDDLEAMGRLAIDLGVDWLKIEEMYPATLLAASELLAPRGERMERHYRALAEVLRGSGVVLVDHRDPPSGCPCEAESNPELAAFRAADDHANRARFHPCRAAWEQACIDPDGAVRPVHSHHAPIGTLAETSLFALWNGEAMRALREEARRRVPEAQRRNCRHVGGFGGPREDLGA